VRELANVIERGVIVSTGNVFDIERALAEAPSGEVAPLIGDAKSDRIYSAPELLELERSNMVRALSACNWKVSGESGAAALLGLNPSTLNSRMRALRIRRRAR
jgi:transcriptional regulator of acetoin/glycerol metabolism